MGQIGGGEARIFFLRFIFSLFFGFVEGRPFVGRRDVIGQNDSGVFFWGSTYSLTRHLKITRACI